MRVFNTPLYAAYRHYFNLIASAGRLGGGAAGH